MLLPGCPCCGTTGGCPPPDLTPTGCDSANNGTWLAQSYIAPAGGITLTSVTLSIASYDPLQATLPVGSYANYPRARIYANEDGTGPQVGNVRPQAGSILATLTPPAVAALNNPTWRFTHGGFAMTAGVRYWISLELNGCWQWHETPDLPPPAPAGLCYGPSATFTTNAGASWVFNAPKVWTPYLLTIN